jgi:hypothetical protein
MPLIAPPSGSAGAFETAISQAGFAQVLFPPAPFPTPLPTTIAGSSNWNSSLMFNDGFRNLTVGVQMNQAGFMVIQQYLDMAGTIPRVVSSTAIVSGTLLIVDLANQAPFTSFTLQITNSGALATIAAFQVILSAG